MDKNKYWHEENGVYELHFTHFYDDEIILTFGRDIGYAVTYWYSSNLLNVEYDYIYTDSIDEAKEIFEDKVREYIEDEITYYKEMLEKFDE